MSRAVRLLDLLQALRRRRRPVTAAVLAQELGVSERTLYRDIASLIAQGAPITGEAGVGYVLQPGFTLPPLMFTEDEIESLVLGLRLVGRRGDSALRKAAVDALAKITDVLPAHLRDRAEQSPLLAAPSGAATSSLDLAILRQAMAKEQKLHIAYVDGWNQRSERTIWPIAIGFFDSVEMLVAWCEMRSDFRHFRTDRIVSAEGSGRLPRRRATLLKEWQKSQDIPEQ